jgi:hypothetical protein
MRVHLHPALPILAPPCRTLRPSTPMPLRPRRTHPLRSTTPATVITMRQSEPDSRQEWGRGAGAKLRLPATVSWLVCTVFEGFWGAEVGWSVKVPQGDVQLSSSSAWCPPMGSFHKSRHMDPTSPPWHGALSMGLAWGQVCEALLQATGGWPTAW